MSKDKDELKEQVTEQVDRRSRLDRLLCKPIPPAQRRQAQADFIEALLKHGGVVTKAVADVEVHLARLYSWRQEEPEFAAAWAEAVEIGADKLEAEAVRRAVEGVDKPVTFQGEITATYKEYSDSLLQFLLKGAKPDKYNRQALQISGPGGAPIQIQRVERIIIDPAAQLPDEDDKDGA